ncbi:hypothetical protein LPJ62_000902 [Coemansia sp. RSA 2167]|nr:hypothetical protein LPJ62_000902 [Coemansia sp. RSA 2167]
MSLALENLIDNVRWSEGAGTDTGAKCSRDSEPLVAEAARKKAKAAGKMPLAAAAAESAGEQADSAAYLQLVRWISLCSKASGSGPKVGREPMMYPWMSAFIAFVAKELASAAAVEEGSEETLKLVSFGNSTLSPMTATTTAESISASFWVLVTPAAPQTPLRRTKTR